MKITREYLTPSQAAERLDTSRQNIHVLRNDGSLPAGIVQTGTPDKPYNLSFFPADYFPTLYSDDTPIRERIVVPSHDVRQAIEKEIDWINNAVLVRTIKHPYYVNKKDVATIIEEQGITMNNLNGEQAISQDDAAKIVWPQRPKSDWPAGKSRERYQTRDKVLTISQARKISPRTKALIDKAGNIDIAPTIAYGVRQLGTRDDLEQLITEWRPEYTSYKGYSVAIVLNVDEAVIAQRLMDEHGLTLPEIADLAIYAVAQEQGLT